MFFKTLKQILRRKIIAGTGLVLIVGGGYFGYQGLAGEKNTTQYITDTARRGTLVLSVSGSGQVSVSNMQDIKAKVSGDIAEIKAIQGQEVKEGDLLINLDSRDAQKTVRDAKTSLTTAGLELEELLKPPDSLALLQSQNALNQARRDLEKLLEPPAAYSLMQAENFLTQAKDNLTKLKLSQATDSQETKEAKQKAKDNLAKAYEDAFNAIANTFLDLPTLITGLRDILYSYGIADSEPTISGVWNISALKNTIAYGDQAKLDKFIDSAKADYQTARTKYDKNFANYKDASRYSARDVIETLLEETLDTTKAIAEAVKSEINMLDYWVDYRSENNLRTFSRVAEYQLNLKSDTAKTNSHLSSLLSAQRSIEDYKEGILKAERNLAEMKQNQPLELTAAENSVEEKEELLADLKAGADSSEIAAAEERVREREESLAELKAGAGDLEIRTKRVVIQQKLDALAAAQEDLTHYSVYAPFDGEIAQLDIKEGDSISANSVVLTLITRQKIAEVTLNEIDAAQVKINQQATLTFDAVAEATLTGRVTEVDTMGAITQGVVTYGVKIVFDSQDARIKPGMTTEAFIITDRKDNVILVPNSVVQAQAGQMIVEVMRNGMPLSMPVEVGLSNDISTEIISGIEEGAIIITAKIGATDNSTASNQSFRLPGMGGSRSSGGYRGGGFMPH